MAAQDPFNNFQGGAFSPSAELNALQNRQDKVLQAKDPYIG